MTFDKIISHLPTLAEEKHRAGMAHFGIEDKQALGIRMPVLRTFAKEIGKNHDVANQLIQSNIHEARILAGLVGEYKKVTADEMEIWVLQFDSWDVCDQCCINLWRKTNFAYSKAFSWSTAEPTFTKRAGFALMAVLCVHDKKAHNDQIEPFLQAIIREAYDERNFVKKAVNWALRQVGKRNLVLNAKAIHAAEEIYQQNTPAAKWIASDAIRELTSDKIQARLRK